MIFIALAADVMAGTKEIGEEVFQSGTAAVDSHVGTLPERQQTSTPQPFLTGETSFHPVTGKL